MQGDVVEYFDEVEPRRMPKPASTFDSRPYPTVPEVSLILEQQKKMENSTENNPPQVKSSITRDPTYKASESYSAWKEKQFPQRTTISPNRLHQIYSSTHNASTLQDSQNYRSSLKSYNSLDYREYNTKSLDEDVPRTYQASRIPHDLSARDYMVSKSSNDKLSNRHDNPNNHEHFPNGNRYVPNFPTNRHEINHHNADSHVNQNYAPRLNSKDGRTSPLSEHVPHHFYERGFEVYDVRQRPRIYRSASFSSADAYARRPMPIEHDYEMKHSKSLQAYHHPPEHSHPGCCSGNHNNSNSETETVKNLLQVITSQNEQIKNLQKQVERLLKLHEQTLKERKHCTCQPNGIARSTGQLYDQSKSANMPVVHNNFLKESEKCLSDLKLQDEKNKKTFLEQKVSIGVMTSFELKVQNNPPLSADSHQNQSKQKSNQEQVLPSLDHTSNILKSLVNDTGEMIRKKKSTYFNPTALENISEASESHMSSFRQSHLCSDTTKQSIETHDSSEVPNTDSRDRNLDRTRGKESHSESRQNLNGSSNKTHRNSDNLDHGVEEVVYQDANRNIREPVYQYNFQYDDRGSSQEDPQEKQADRFNSDEPLASEIRKMKNTRRDNLADECLSLSGSDLDVEDLSPPSPEPSIHLDMQEFSDEGGSLPPQQAPKPGWTLYNNVLDQVNQILQNSPINDDQESTDGRRHNKKREYDNNYIVDTVKAATLEQLTKLGISFSDNVDQREQPYNKKVVFDASSYQRQGPEAHFTTTSASIETNTSMHMKALAMKYFNDEQLADFGQKSRPSAMKQSSTGIQNTNMSFATMHYLQRYHLLPGSNSSPRKEYPREDYRVASPVNNERMARQTAERRGPSPHGYAQFTGTSKVSYPSKILDISTLKQQPKLL